MGRRPVLLSCCQNGVADLFRANWILRGALLPAGDGDITFTFKPESFVKGEKYSLIASSILILLLVAAIVLSLRKKKEHYGYSCLTNQRGFYRENCPSLVLEKSGLDEVITLMARGEEV